MSLKQKPTLEELLKLKRIETPSKKDWAEFDVQLKRKLFCRMVADSSQSPFKLPQIGRKTLWAAAAALSFCAAILLPLYTGVFSANEVSSVSERAAMKCTPLPKLSQNFADKILAAESEESPVLAPMSLNSAAAIRYVSNGIVSADNPAF